MWVPTRKIFTSSTTKVNRKPPHALNKDITNLYECEQTLNVSAYTINLSAACVDHPVLEVAALVFSILTSSPSSTSVDQDAPLLSTSQTPQASPSYVITTGAEKADHDIEVTHMDNNP
ncbi:hypothetical protein Tco_1341609 [Tanacetum coccineum]